MLPLTLQTAPFDPPGGWQRCLDVLTRRPHAVLFDSAMPGELGRDSFLSFGPTMLLSCTGQAATWVRGKSASMLEGNPLDLFERVERFTQQECPLVNPPHVRGFYGGWAGLLGFDLRCHIEKLAPPKPGGPQFPDLWAGFYPWTLAWDGAACELRHLRGAPGAFTDIAELAQALESLLLQDVTPSPFELGAPEFSTSREEYLRQVAIVKEHIRQGDIYQANLTREVARAGQADPVSLYLRLRTHNAAPFGGFLDCGQGRCVLSSSPERFVSVHDGVVETRPIKGTRPRGETPERDEQLRSELLHSPKDRAELVMIVDLERNDLSRVCLPGTVKVPSLMHVHTFARVHHMEATVQGRMREGVTPAGLIRATFPGGSISGAPKVRALQILHEIEPVRRGPYTGSLFYLTADFRFESNILIRTLLREPGRTSYHVGGGIVADSDPDAEWAETCAKAEALELALGAA